MLGKYASFVKDISWLEKLSGIVTDFGAFFYGLF
jgi:hypothetical protein